jgi:vacuolar-type H+-ATPase subunit F/Vma7
MEQSDEQQGMLRRKDVAVLGDESMTLGFRLAGVGEYAVVDEADQAGYDLALSHMMESDKLAVIIAAQPQLSRISPAISKRMMGQQLPIVIGVPCRAGCADLADPIRQMLKRTLGIEPRREG